jgi:uncharacterized protein
MLGELSPGQIEDLLRAEVLGHLGCHAEGRTYVVPIIYAYERGDLICQSAEGMKLRLMRQNPLVCIEVERVETLAKWQSVIAWGRFEELIGSAADAAMSLLRERLSPLIVSSTSQPVGGQIQGHGNGHAALFRIRLYEKTGRFEQS